MLRLAFTALLACAAQAAAAADFPSRPISLIVPNPPGGLVDTSARLAADPLAKVLGSPVVVENKDGGSGNIAYQGVARAQPDGHTLLVSYSAYHVGNPNLTKNLRWDPVKDFEPVGLVSISSNVIAVHPSVPADDLQGFIAELKQKPGHYSYASQGVGSLSHIGTEIFTQQTGTKMLHVPYRGSGAAIQDVLGGNVQVFITTPPSVMGHVRTGKLKGLAVTSAQRHPMLPDVPTVAEAGLGDYQLEAWVALFAPAGTPAPVIEKLASSLEQALTSPETVERARAAGIEARFEGPQALAERVRTELAYWGKTIQAANISID
ncbi:tripartite tricarboxylate transporter substrate binding protein [Orrella sp. JC864]|uniref:Bug family tripartite tricarboxylate transporter substrate binding protein n=1 Tax=Orrella sp. JC864 TaxID=3120298 RepID=UPI00300A6C21